VVGSDGVEEAVEEEAGDRGGLVALHHGRLLQRDPDDLGAVVHKHAGLPIELATHSQAGRVDVAAIEQGEGKGWGWSRLPREASMPN
jgi:hypothetical protein